MKIIKKVWGIIPGLAISILIAVVAKTIESRLPIHIVGASVIALFIGMIINHFWRPDFLKAGIKFASKKVLKFAMQYRFRKNAVRFQLPCD